MKKFSKVELDIFERRIVAAREFEWKLRRIMGQPKDNFASYIRVPWFDKYPWGGEYEISKKIRRIQATMKKVQNAIEEFQKNKPDKKILRKIQRVSNDVVKRYHLK